MRAVAVLYSPNKPAANDVSDIILDLQAYYYINCSLVVTQTRIQLQCVRSGYRAARRDALEHDSRPARGPNGLRCPDAQLEVPRQAAY